MAGQTTGLQKTYKIMDADGVLRFTGLTRGAGAGEAKKPVADGAVFLGVVVNDERDPNSLSAGGVQTGRNVSVQIAGIGSIKLGGAVAFGDRLMLKAGGSAIVIPAVPGNYNAIGIAEKAGVLGDVIPFTIAPESVTK
jgi:hypothetical protein